MKLYRTKVLHTAKESMAQAVLLVKLVFLIITHLHLRARGLERSHGRNITIERRKRKSEELLVVQTLMNTTRLDLKPFLNRYLYCNVIKIHNSDITMVSNNDYSSVIVKYRIYSGLCNCTDEIYRGLL